jgi:4-alpha-glucanotransferase
VTSPALSDLADAAGIAIKWRDVQGSEHEVAEPTLHAVLQALGHRTGSQSQIHESLAALRAPPDALPPLVTAQAGQNILLKTRAARTRLRLEDGRLFDGHAEQSSSGAVIPAILEPGYHRLEIGDQETTIAVAPERCTTLRDLLPGGRAVAIAAQIYALRRRGDAGIGDFAALGDFVEAAARQGAQGVAISPVHAQFSADPHRFGPYAPSSRVALNVLHAPIDLFADNSSPWQAQSAALEALDLVDWPQAAAARLGRLRSIFAQAAGQPRWMEPFQAFRAAQGEGLERHAVFEALHGHFFHADPALWHWRNWPQAFQSPQSPDVAAFAHDHKPQVDFHAFLQFLADRGLADAQDRARSAGMAIGLITDLAVGTDGGGSHCWARQRETLLGLTVGAPPDMFQRAGQNWGLAAFSPLGLQACGFTAFLEMLRAALAHAGGVRIDHSMGLHRLWVIPEGAGATEGAYLRFPEPDLLRLIALESHRAKAIVVAEDLGTLPDGFQDRLQHAGIAGMRVLWFERDQTGHFTDPARWSRQAAAMTTTHDLPTVTGWWQGRDIAWRAQLEPGLERASADAERARERGLLWDAMQHSGAARGDAPEADAPARAVDAAIAHVAASNCDLLILPIEDILGLPEQPNLPNTIDEHPNWRRRLPGNAAELFDTENAATRLRVALNGRNT